MPPDKMLSRSDALKRVIVFAPELLPISQTFIREQVRALKCWCPILVGDRLVPDGLSLDGLAVRLLCPPEEGRFRRWTYVLCRILRLPHLPSVWRLRKLGASLIHVHFGTAAVDIWPTARALSLPMLVTLHGYDINIYRQWWESGKDGWQRKRYPQRLIRLAQEPNVKFIAVSEAIRKRAIEYGIPSGKITVHYIGVDTKKFSPRPEPISQRQKHVLFVGRLVEKKGAEYLIRAFSQIHNDIPDAKLIIVGDGPQRAALQDLATTLGVAAEFTGAQTSDLIAQQMHLADVFCLPSITAENGDAEGFGLVLLEAQASGVPVVSSAVGGAREGLVDSVTGFCFSEKDVKALADRLQKILSDDNLRFTLSANAVAYTRENFELDSCSRKMEKIYDSSIDLPSNTLKHNE